MMSVINDVRKQFSRLYGEIPSEVLDQAGELWLKHQEEMSDKPIQIGVRKNDSGSWEVFVREQ